MADPMREDDQTSLIARRLARLIAATGPIPLSQFMAEANAHYYATRDPLGAQGDFVTAPEISQIFGELIGLWLTDLWTRAGSPGNARYVELGPGRGTLAADALRAMRAARFEPPVELVETSPVLRASQASRLPAARWHDDLDGLPDDAPLLVVANEFFDALPVRQIIRTNQGWFETMVAHEDGRFAPVLSGPPLDALIPESLRAAPSGSVIETSPAVESTARALASRIAVQGGAALIIDYGYSGPALGDTLQAVARHDYADVFAEPGMRDLTAHVDFALIGRLARDQGLRSFGPVDQGDWLNALGIDARAAVLARFSPERRDEILAARDRLTGRDQMGTLFKVLALVAPKWPDPAAF